MEKEFYLIVSIFVVMTILLVVVLLLVWREREKRYENHDKERYNQMLIKELIDKNQQNEVRLRDLASTLNKFYSMISSNRNKIEDKIYDSSAYFTKDNDTFVDANRVILDTQDNQEMLIHKKLPNSSFFEGMAINLTNVKVNDRMVVCLMPFNSKFDSIRDAIADACYMCGYSFRRSDDKQIDTTNDLRKSIIKMILEAGVIIAVLDGRNPNVYYEIGIAHSMGKLVLMVVNLDKEKPTVDLLPNRLITYSDPIDLNAKLIKAFHTMHYD